MRVFEEKDGLLMRWEERGLLRIRSKGGLAKVMLGSHQWWVEHDSVWGEMVAPALTGQASSHEEAVAQAEAHLPLAGWHHGDVGVDLTHSCEACAPVRVPKKLKHLIQD